MTLFLILHKNKTKWRKATNSNIKHIMVFAITTVGVVVAYYMSYITAQEHNNLYSVFCTIFIGAAFYWAAIVAKDFSNSSVAVILASLTVSIIILFVMTPLNVELKPPVFNGTVVMLGVIIGSLLAAIKVSIERKREADKIQLG